MVAVGLDISTKLGVACWYPGTSQPTFTTVHLRGDPEDVGRPMEALRSHLADIHKLEAITHLFFEATILPHARVGDDGKAHMRTSPQTVYKLCALAGMAEWFAKRVDAHCRQVEQQRWRKHFMGRGTGPSKELKEAAIAAARARGWNVQTDHEADALGVLDYGLSACFKIPVPWRDVHLFNGALAGAGA